MSKPDTLREIEELSRRLSGFALRRVSYVCSVAEFQELMLHFGHQPYGGPTPPMVYSGILIQATAHWPEGLEGKVLPIAPKLETDAGTLTFHEDHTVLECKEPLRTISGVVKAGDE
jgi:hypothetical protein